ncbi:MAG: hypothetical protein GF364_05395 [Candidatus Lokiarchaeota archaeon]|nr:hypothetical protein [Candidatus Lokiarchaeota archaeon]
MKKIQLLIISIIILIIISLVVFSIFNNEEKEPNILIGEWGVDDFNESTTNEIWYFHKDGTFTHGTYNINMTDYQQGIIILNFSTSEETFTESYLFYFVDEITICFAPDNNPTYCKYELRKVQSL